MRGSVAIDVGPDFDALGIEAGAKNGCRKIRSSASDGSGNTGTIGPNKAAHHRHLA
jgi:hypothetical protein